MVAPEDRGSLRKGTCNSPTLYRYIKQAADMSDCAAACFPGIGNILTFRCN
jgi:hypothetical protein